MFGFQRKESKERQDFREEFERTAIKVRKTDTTTQIAVGLGISMGLKMFLINYKNNAEFQKTSAQEIEQFIRGMTQVEQGLIARYPGDPTVIGFGLVKMWVGALASNDEVLASSFSRELAALSTNSSVLFS